LNGAFGNPEGYRTMSNPVTPAEAKELRALVRSIVVAQGNLFIRELLRKNGLRIGVNKAEFEQNLIEAITAGKLRLSQVREWLEEVEGWGDQHVYLYEVPREILNDPKWDSANSVRESLPLEHRKLWHPEKVQHFPAKPTLTGIFYEQEALQYVWHSAYETWHRTPDRDYRNKLEADLYEFRAYRQRQDRTVRRFVLRRDLALAGIFLQTEWSEKEHSEALLDVNRTVGKAIPFDRLRSVSMSLVIKRLDQMELAPVAKDTNVQAQKTRLADAGAYVEFASTSDLGYMQSEEVRRVRNAVRADTSMIGANGTFIYPAKTPTGLDRPVKFDIFGEQRRVKLRSQLTASDVWVLLSHLKRAEAWSTLTKGQHK
jgi:hypothetical protein